jgi:hypothetical protein
MAATAKKPAAIGDKAKALSARGRPAPSKTQSLSCSDAQGAGVDVLVKETGWQKHSVRGFLTGRVRKKLKLPLVSVMALATAEGDL